MRTHWAQFLHEEKKQTELSSPLASDTWRFLFLIGVRLLTGTANAEQRNKARKHLLPRHANYGKGIRVITYAIHTYMQRERVREKGGRWVSWRRRV